MLTKLCFQGKVLGRPWETAMKWEFLLPFGMIFQSLEKHSRYTLYMAGIENSTTKKQIGACHGGKHLESQYSGGRFL